MDTYLEFLVKQKYTLSKVLMIAGLFLLAGILSFLSFFVAVRNPVVMQLICLIWALFFYGAWWLSQKLCVEYEYIVTNDELDVDRIIAKKTRKRLLTVSVKKFEEFGCANKEKIAELKNRNFKVILDASSGSCDDMPYYAVFDNKQGESMLLIFNPTDRMLNSFKIFNPRVVNI
ncbi:MAG: hypothetical protein E7411_02385 [Ruminococcaceae bacterium]|nr:hypothetical protein [Oscillospiraceae bacterium]